jgi:hypothetical protein
MPDAIAVGVRPEAIKALRAQREEELTAREQALTAYIRLVVQGAVTDEAYANMETLLGPRGAVEYTIFIAFLSGSVRIWQALGLEDPPDAEMDELLTRLRREDETLPDPRRGIG